MHSYCNITSGMYKGGRQAGKAGQWVNGRGGMGAGERWAAGGGLYYCLLGLIGLAMSQRITSHRPRHA